MVQEKSAKRAKGAVSVAAAILILAILCMQNILAVPSGPSITVLGNSTRVSQNSTKVNSTNGTVSPGGFIFTVSMDAQEQNRRWKAYVGNVTGKLVLDDADGYSIFQWELSTVTGEVYASRAQSSINWSGINCTWIADGMRNQSQARQSSNRTPEHNENIFLSQSNRDDNITSTFRYTNHSSLEVGSIAIGKDQCFALQTYRNDSQQAFTDSNTANFTQVVLYDGGLNTTTGNLIYATKLETDKLGYRPDSTYDFQMLLPEVGLSTWTSSTAYYFYVELT